MTVTVAEIHAYACSLAHGGSEVVLRAAVGRAYYSAYHACKDWHAALKYPGRNRGPSGGVHQQLINCLRNPDPAIGSDMALKSRRVASQLELLKSERTLADYSIRGHHLDIHAATGACLLAKKILDELA